MPPPSVKIYCSVNLGENYINIQNSAYIIELL